jgi:hypothetical protein
MNSFIKIDSKDLIGHTIRELSIIKDSEITCHYPEYHDGLLCIKTETAYFYGKFICLTSGRYGKFHLLERNKKDMECISKLTIKNIKKIYVGKKIIGSLLKTDYKYYEIIDTFDDIYNLYVSNLYKNKN